MGEPAQLRQQQTSDKCGCFCCKSPCLRRLSHVNVFMVIFSAIFILSLSIAGYFAGVLSTLEKRFQLKSAEVGALTTVSSAVSLSLVVFLSYYGQNKHRPRLIAVGAVFVGIGAVLMSFPQFLYDTPPFLIVANLTELDNHGLHMCQTNAGPSSSTDNTLSCLDEGTDNETLSSSTYGVSWLIVGQTFIGIGSSAFLPLAITFIDDNVAPTSTSLYVGVLFASSGIAPMLGFGLSSLCLSYYTDYYKSTPSVVSTDEQNWLGAWWLGFLIYGITTLLLAVPMFMFPKRMSDYYDENSEHDTVTTVTNTSSGDGLSDMLDMSLYRPSSLPADGQGKCAVVKGFLSALHRILTNPAFVIIVFAVCLAFAAISGFLTFGAKYIETQYGVPPAYSPLILAGMVAPGGIVGNFLAGYIVKKLKLNMLGCARMILILSIPMAFLAPIIFFLGCENPDIAGLTVDYGHVTSHMPFNNMTQAEALSLSLPASMCNSHCQCDKVYSPVCGSDGVTYVSPCYAGCNEDSVNEYNRTTYQNCVCISYTNQTDETLYSAQKGMCPRQCNTLWAFAGAFTIVFLVNCIWSNPAFMLYLRVVDAKDRSIAVGFASLALKVLGFIPAPIFYGNAIQSTCLLSWQLSCEETGACLVYDIWQFRFNFLGLTYGLLLLVTLFMIAAYFPVKQLSKRISFPIERSSNLPVEFQPSTQLPYLASADTVNGNR